MHLSSELQLANIILISRDSRERVSPEAQQFCNSPLGAGISMSSSLAGTAGWMSHGYRRIET